MPELAEVEDIMQAMSVLQRTNGPWDVGISGDAYLEMCAHCESLGVDDVAFFAGVAVGVELERMMRRPR